MVIPTRQTWMSRSMILDVAGSPVAAGNINYRIIKAAVFMINIVCVQTPEEHIWYS